MKDSKRVCSVSLPLPKIEAAISRASRDRLNALCREFVQSASVGVLFIGAGDEIVLANDAVCCMFGYESSDLVGKPIELLMPGFITEVHLPIRGERQGRPEPAPLAARPLLGKRKDGSVIGVFIDFAPLKPMKNRCIACTVTELDGAQAAERDLARFFEISLDLFCIASLDGYFQRVNPNFSRLLGYSDTELLARPFLDFVHPDDAASTLAVVGELMKGEPIVRFRNRYRRARGDLVWLEWTACAVPEENTIYATARNITDQVLLEEELVTREARERAILENTPANVYVRNRDGRYAYVNRRHADLYKLTVDAVVGKHPCEVFAKNSEQVFANDEIVFETAETVVLQETFPQADGMHTYVSTKFPLLDSHGQVAAVAGISTDITEQIRSQETEHQLQLAREFQRKLYPARAPQVDGFQAAGSAVPVAHLCGDYYDFILNKPGRLTVAMGDVSGHGINSALEMVAVRTAMRMWLREDRSLSYAVEKLNRMLTEDLPESSFVSLFVAELDSARRRIRYIGAGHEAWLRRVGGSLVRLQSTGPLLGIDEDAEYEVKSVEGIECGDLFLLYTDGLIEAMDVGGKQFGVDRLMHAIRQQDTSHVDQLVGHAFSTVYEFTHGQAITDDMTLVAARFTK